MQWVVTTGRSVADATARALDALGIDESDLEVEVLAEASTSWFGLRTTDARIRARVRPTRPRPKVDRRNRRGTGDKRRRRGRAPKGASTADRGAERDPAAEPQPADVASAPRRSDPPPKPKARSNARDGAADRSEPPTPRSTDQPASRSGGTRGASMSDIPLDSQEPTAVDFVRGVVEAFGADADVSAFHDDDDDAVEIRVEGDDLGLLVGPRGATLSAIAELTRTAVAQQHSGRLEGRLRVDIAGYRARRKEALVRFAGQIADQVLESGEPAALEPMSPPDRKIVHDAVNDIDGVHTVSRGEDRQRHVMIQPD